jgi:Holliday junction resolvase RusA-like endonuclease
VTSALLEATVAGKPVQKGSWRVSKTGHLYSDSPGLKGWQERIGLAVWAERAGKPPTDMHIALEVEFRFARPPSHFTKTGRLRKGAPLAPGRPDLDKLLRGLLDGLTGVLFRDDAQVTELEAAKCYAEAPGVFLRAWAPDYRAEVES